MARQALTLVAALAVALLVYSVLVGIVFAKIAQLTAPHPLVQGSRCTPSRGPFVAPATATPSDPQDAVEHRWIILAALIAPLLWCCVELHVLLLRRRQEEGGGEGRRRKQPSTLEQRVS